MPEQGYQDYGSPRTDSVSSKLRPFSSRAAQDLGRGFLVKILDLDIYQYTADCEARAYADPDTH